MADIPKQVFISYKREDEPFARKLCEHIREWGYQPWLDVDEIQPGDDWARMINTGLKASEIVLGIMTPESVHSQNVLNEWSFAAATQKRFFLLLLREVSAEDIPHEHIRRQWIDCRNNVSDGLAQLKKALDLGQGNPETTAEPTPPPPPSNRSRMLQKVYDFWVTGVLENALKESGTFELGLSAAPERVLKYIDFDDYELPRSTQIIDVFRNLDCELLILGTPGSGKTIMLLQLARALIQEAQQVETVPIPVVFNLSSWAAERKPLEEWLKDELRDKYQVPKKVAAQWVEGERLLLLLDGLDEVAEAYRGECVDAINRFRQLYKSVNMAVCSRIADYEALKRKLVLQGAIVLQPLSPETIDGYLAQDGLAALRQVIATDETLREMASVPFLLNTMALAYKNGTVINLRLPAGENDAQGWRKHLFEHYLEKRSQVIPMQDAHYTPREVRHFLATLAQWLVKNQQTVFFIEGLQPDWLEKSGRYREYRVLVGAAIAWTYGLAYAVTFGGLVGLIIDPLEGLLLAMILILLFGFSIIPLVDPKKIELDETLRLSWDRHDLIIGLGIGIGAAVVSLGVGLAFHMLESSLSVGLAAGLVGMLGAGISSAENLELRSTPNQGVWRSVENSFRVGIMVALGIGIPSLLLTSVLVNVGMGIAVGLLAGLGFGLFLGMLFGVRVLVKHLALRFILWRTRQIPLNYAQFLDYAAIKLRVLRKVGGGYIFIHRYLLDYFAALEENIE